jgi:hypothetical protein
MSLLVMQLQENYPMNFERARKELLPYVIGFSASALAVLSFLAAMPPQPASPTLMGKLKGEHHRLNQASRVRLPESAG